MVTIDSCETLHATGDDGAWKGKEVKALEVERLHVNENSMLIGGDWAIY